MGEHSVFFEKQVLSLALLEKELYQLYTNLSQKVEDIAAKALFSYIATDSLKHSTILVSIIDEVNGSKVRERDCDINILYNKDVIKTLSKNIARSSTIDRGRLIPIIDQLANFEHLLHNEYKKAFRLEIRNFNPNKFGKENEEDLNILTLIVEDEERHQRILAAIANLCDRKLSFTSNTPIVKYQSPDNWYVPPRSGRR